MAMALFDDQLPYPVSAAYTSKPIQNVLVNVGSEKRPLYEECRVYPAFPWKLISEEDDHTGEDAKAFWDLALSVGAIPEPKEASKKGLEEVEDDRS